MVITFLLGFEFEDAEQIKKKKKRTEKENRRNTSIMLCYFTADSIAVFTTFSVAVPSVRLHCGDILFKSISITLFCLRIAIYAQMLFMQIYSNPSIIISHFVAMVFACEFIFTPLPAHTQWISWWKCGVVSQKQRQGVTTHSTNTHIHTHIQRLTIDWNNQLFVQLVKCTQK